MGLLDRLSGLREDQENREEAARARSRRNVAVGTLQDLSRERRIDRASPRSKREAVESARRQIEEARKARARARKTEAEAKSRTPREERSILRRAASGIAGVARTALEAEAEARDRKGQPNRAAAARAQDAATAGAPIRGATLDPSPGETAEMLARGGLMGLEEPGLETGEDGLLSDDFILGTGPPGDPDGDGKIEKGPLEFDDPLGLTGGLE